MDVVKGMGCYSRDGRFSGFLVFQPWSFAVQGLSLIASSKANIEPYDAPLKGF